MNEATKPLDSSTDALEGKHLTLSIKTLSLYKLDETEWKKKK